MRLSISDQSGSIESINGKHSACKSGLGGMERLHRFVSRLLVPDQMVPNEMLK